MVMGKDGGKLSKRHGATSVLEFRKNGYLPEALLNYVTMVGWSFDDSREFFSKEDLENLFDISRITKAPGVFDYKKLDWFNGQYMRELDPADLYARILPHIQAAGIVADPPSESEKETLEGLVPIIQERLKLLTDAPSMVRFVFQEIERWDIAELLPKKLEAGRCAELLGIAAGVLKSSYGKEDEALEEALKQKAEELGEKVGNFLMPLRVAVTGTKISPPLIPSIRLVGLEKSVERIEKAQDFLRNEETA